MKKYELDKKTFYYAKEVVIGNQTLKTPVTTLHPSQKLTNLPIKSNINFTELWKTLDYQKIKDAPEDNKVATKLSQEISKEGSNLRDTLRSYFISIKNKPGNPFNKIDNSLITTIVDNVYRFTDLLVFPSFNGTQNIINNELVLSDFLKFIDQCYEIMETLNNKPIMAIIHPIPINFIPQITRRYLKYGIQCFCFDFVGSGLNSYYAHYKAFLRDLYNYDQKSIGEILKYSLNLRIPSNFNPNGPFPAEDLIAPALGLDILGINHIGGGSSKVKTSTLEKKKPKKQLKINLVDTDIYAYRRIGNQQEFDKYFPNSLISVDFDTISSSITAKSLTSRNFNYTQKTIELNSIHDKIMNNESIFQSLRTKNGLDDARKSIIGNITTIKNPIDSYFQ